MAEEFDYTSDDPQAEFQRQQFAKALQMGGNYVGQKMAEDTAAYHANPTEWAMNKGITNAMGTIGTGKASGLAMDEASRLARAQKMGFDTSKTMYHGTKADIEAFNPEALGSSTNAGSARRGYFFAEDPSTAGDYAGISSSRNSLRAAAGNPEAAALEDLIHESSGLKGLHMEERLKELQRSGPEQNKSYLAQLNIGKKYLQDIASGKVVEKYPRPADYLKQKLLEYDEKIANAKKSMSAASEKARKKEMADIQDKINKADQLKKTENAGQNVIPVHLKMENPYTHDFEGKSYRDESYNDILKKAKEAGHDSVILKNTYDPANPENRVKQDIHVVFNPSQVRSKFAEFNPKNAKKSGLSYASGGLVKQLSGFKKIKSGPHVTILKHPAGHEISIAHAGLGDGLKRQLESMPMHLDEGGAIPIATDPAQAAIPEALANPSPGSGALAPNGVGSADIPRQPFDAAQFGLSEEEAAKVRESLKSGQPYESPGGEEMVPTAAPKEDNEIKPASASYAYKFPQAQAAPQQAQPISYQSPYEMEAKAAVENEKAVQNLQATTKGHLDALTQERENLLKDYTAGHVDPNKYLHDLDAGGKATTAIGLLLGGISSGLTGKSNPAIDYLHNQIENSIKSQTLNLGKTQSMLDMNLKQFGNIRDATDMTRAIASDYLASKMKEAETKIKDPMARQQMLMAISQLQNQANGYTQQVASRQGVKSAAKQGGVDPTLQIRVLIPDPHEQEPYFKELQTAQNMSKQRDNLMQTFDELSQVNTVGHTLAHPIDTHAVNQRAMAQLAALAKESEGRVTEADVAFLQGLYPKRGTSPAETMKRRQAMLNYVSQKMNFPRLDSIGVVIPAAPNFIKPNPGVTSGYSAPAPMQVGYHQ